LSKLVEIRQIRHLKKGEIVAKTEQKRSILPFKIGASVDISGKVQKVVKRDGLCKLVIEPANALGFIVFANCLSDAAMVKAQKIQKGSPVSVRGRFASYGSKAVCLIDCRLL
jgi:hypothetical protein